MKMFDFSDDENIKERIETVFYELFPYEVRKYFKWRSYYRYFFDRYDVVKTKLNRFEYHDSVQLLPETLLQIIINFVEKEKAGDIIDWEADEFHSAAWKNIMGAYFYAKITKKNREIAIEEKLDEWNTEWLKGGTPLVSLIHDKLQVNEFPHAKSEKETNLFNELTKLEEDYEIELSNWLIKIVKVRNSLWT